MTYVKRTKRAKSDPELVKLADSLIAVVDGLRDVPDTIEVVYPQAQIRDMHRAPDPQFHHAGLLEGP
ncbi:transposase, Mutator family [Collimonas pratensis]|uniref:Transposase, Mutator family n=1 Tax=Collimonas pratensis TaxID=279113 RepID=A0A127QBH3_9BURK|nr:transposase, Mutator family [Collimonas pratensis]